MQRIPLQAEEREVLGKKVKLLRAQGLIPAHVFGNQVETEHVTISLKDLLPVIHQAGETGLIDLKIGAEKIRPVMIRGVQYNPVKGGLLHVDFYQVNLKEKVTVPVPIVLKYPEEELDIVKLGEAIYLQTLMEVEVEALPTDLIDQIEVDISSLKAIDDSIYVKDLPVDRELITVLAEEEELVVKMDNAVSDEAAALAEELEAEAEAAAAAAEGEEGAEEGKDGEEGEESAEGESEETKEEDSDKKDSDE